MIWLYFIQQGYGGPVKIGLASDPQKRLEQLQVGNPQTLCLRAQRPGHPELEADLHRLFASGHIRGEWFRPDTPFLRVTIERAKDETLTGRYVSRDEVAALREARERRAVDLVRRGRWDEAQELIATVPPENGALV